MVDLLSELSGPDVNNMIKVDHLDYDHVALILYVLEGDNKSIGEAAGYVGAAGRYPCNQCYVMKDEMRVMIELDETLKRTKESYALDIIDCNGYETGKKLLYLILEMVAVYTRVGTSVV